MHSDKKVEKKEPTPEQLTNATQEGMPEAAPFQKVAPSQLLPEPGENEAVRSPFAAQTEATNYPLLIAQSLIDLTTPEVSKTITTILLACAAAIQVHDKRTLKFSMKVGKLADELGFVQRERSSKKGKKDKDKKRKKKDRKKSKKSR